MSKVSLNDIVNLQNETSVVSTINANNAVIETAFDNTLSRDGSFPNQMQSVLDMNSNHILNLPAPFYDTDPIRLSDLNAIVLGTNINPTGNITFPGVGGQSRSIANAVYDYPSSLDWNTNAHALTQMAVNGGTLFVPATGTFDFVPIFPNMPTHTIGFDFLGPLIPFISAIGFPIGSGPEKSNRVFYSNGSGTHSDITESTVAILRTAKGSGINGPASMDAALTIGAAKINAGTTNEIGQINGINMYVRNGGLDGVTSDASGLDINVANYGPTGGVFILEGLSTNISKLGAIVTQIDTQVGVLNTIGNFRYGFVATCNTNTGGTGEAFLAQEAGGTWTNWFRGGTTFAVARSGDIITTGTITSTGSITTSGSLTIGVGQGINVPGFGVIDFTNGTTIYRAPADGSLTLTSQSGVINTTSSLNLFSTAAIPVGGSTTLGLKFGSYVGIFYGSGVPTLNAIQGSIYMRSDGASTTTRAYICLGGTSWTGITTVA